MSEIEKNYNFEDEVEGETEGKPEIHDHEHKDANKKKKRVITRNHISVWEKIKPMLHYYIIAAIAFCIAGVMMYNAYKTLYPEQKVAANQTKNLSFSEAAGPAQRAFNPGSSATTTSVPSFSSSTVKNNNGDIQVAVSATNAIDKKTASLMHSDIIVTNKKLSALEQQLNSLSKEIKYLAKKKDKTQGIEVKLDQLTQSVQETVRQESSNITALYQQIEANRQSLLQLEKMVQESNSTVKLMLANQYNHREKLSLRAIVTGRAWLVNHAGVTYTVTQGSQVPGYGKVIKIDDDKEQVVMSSGYIFK